MLAKPCLVLAGFSRIEGILISLQFPTSVSSVELLHFIVCASKLLGNVGGLQQWILFAHLGISPRVAQGLSTSLPTGCNSKTAANKQIFLLTTTILSSDP